jgi:hypothetical protein
MGAMLSGLLFFATEVGVAQEPQTPPRTASSSPTTPPAAPQTPSEDPARPQPVASQPGQTSATPEQGTPDSQTSAPPSEPCPACKEEPAQKPPPTATKKPKPPTTNKSAKTDSRQTTKAGSSKTSAPQAEKPAAGQSGKIVVRNGGAKNNCVQISPGLSNEQEVHNRENTDRLLATTDANLKLLEGRQLTESQQSMLAQIHTYVRQARSAAEAGDVVRAHTLAYKAHLLSDELVPR